MCGYSVSSPVWDAVAIWRCLALSHPMNEYHNLLLCAAECAQLAREANDLTIREKLTELGTDFLRLANEAKSLEDAALTLENLLRAHAGARSGVALRSKAKQKTGMTEVSFLRCEMLSIDGGRRGGTLVLAQKRDGRRLSASRF